MVILDTDHLTVIQRKNPTSFFILSGRLRRLPPGEVCTTIVNVEEQMRGWLAMIRSAKKSQQEIASYRQLHELFSFLQRFQFSISMKPQRKEWQRSDGPACGLAPWISRSLPLRWHDKRLSCRAI